MADDDFRRLLGQVVSDGDGQPIPGVRVSAQMGGFAGEVGVDRFGAFECTMVRREDFERLERDSKLHIQIADPKGNRLPVADVPDKLRDVPVTLRVKIKPQAIDGVDWFAVRRMFELVPPQTVGTLAQELAAPSAFALATVPLADRNRHLNALERAVVDPSGILQAQVDPHMLTFDRLRLMRGAAIPTALEGHRVAGRERARLASALDRAVINASRGSLLALNTRLASVDSLRSAFAPDTAKEVYRIAAFTDKEVAVAERHPELLSTALKGDPNWSRGIQIAPEKLDLLRRVIITSGASVTAVYERPLRDRWNATVDALNLRDHLRRAPAEVQNSPRLLLRAAAKTPPRGGVPRDDTERRLTWAARLSVLGVSAEGATALGRAKVTSVATLAHAEGGYLADVLGGAANLPAAQALRYKAQQALGLARARLVDIALGASRATGSIGIYYHPEAAAAPGLVAVVRESTPPDSCEPCENCMSALSPAAYLIDLLDLFSDSFGWLLAQIESRFREPFGSWTLDCDAVEQTKLQIVFANEALSRFIRERRGADWRQLGQAEIDALEDEFRALNAPDTYPSALFDAYDAYRSELRVDLGAVTQALANPAQRLVMARALGLAEADLPHLVLAPNAVHRGTVDQVYELLVKSKRTKITELLMENLRAETYATARSRLADVLNPADPNYAALVLQAEQQATAEATAAVNAAMPALAIQAEEEAREYVRRVRRQVDQILLPQVRANLIYIAFQAVAANPITGRPITDARALGDYLCVDLAVSDCLETTRVGFAIESLQTLVQAFLLGRESIQPNTFDLRRWRWMRSYGLWAAAKSVFLYPENFLAPQFRRQRTESFERMTSGFEEKAPTRKNACDALLAFSEEVRDFAGIVTERMVQVGDRLYLLCIGALTRYLYISSLGTDGSWSAWRRIEELRGRTIPAAIPLPDIQDVTVVGERILVLYRELLTFKAVALIFEPEGSFRATIEVAADNVMYARAAVLQNPYGQTVKFFVRKFPVQGAPPNARPQLDVYTMGADQQQVTLEPKQLYLAPRTDLRAVVAHSFGTGSLAFNPKFLFTCIAYGDATHTHRLLTYAIPFSVVPMDPNTPGDTLLDSYQHLDIDLEANVDASRLSLLSLGPLVYGGPGLDQFVLAFNRQTSTGPSNRVYLANVGNLQIAKSLIMSSASAPIPSQLASTYFTCAGVFNGSVYGAFTNWIARLPGATDNWNALESWRVVGQVCLAAEHVGRPLRVDLDVLRDPQALPAFRSLQIEHWDAVVSSGYARRYLEELFLHAPAWLAAVLNEEDRFEAAREVLEIAFRPFGSGLPSPFLYEGILREQAMTGAGFDYRNSVEYLHNPFDPHAIAGIRPLTHARYIVQAYADNMVDGADAEFTRDTAESVAAARELYEAARDVLDLQSVPKDLCASGYSELLLSVLKAQPTSVVASWRPVLVAIWKELRRLDDVKLIAGTVRDVKALIASKRSEPEKRAGLVEILNTLRARQGQRRRTVKETVDMKKDETRNDELEIWALSQFEELDDYDGMGVIAPAPALYFDYAFCIPRNPAYDGMRFRIESNLDKIRTCRNIAGIRRSLETYATLQDPTALVQQAASGGGEIEDFIPAEPPPMFRYAYLWERARQAITSSQHVESYLLSSLEKRDAADYSLLQAKNDLKLAAESVATHSLRVREASLGVTQATLQRDRATFSTEHFESLIQGGLNGFEELALVLLRIASFLPSSLSVTVGMSPSVSVGYSPSGILQNEAFISNTLASYERRAEEWQYQLALAQWDERIGQGQIDVANAGLDIANQELDVASITAELGARTVEFLSEQFTSAELYRWMVGELRKLYRRELLIAVGLARSAQQALAFELQEPLNFVGSQYWEMKREGLLGAEKLMLDLDRLDQHRIAKAERRRELTKTISLALAMPSEFQQFRQTGLLTFATPASWFDRDFPGHYMRLVKSVEFSIVALTPAIDGIRANVSHHGLSRVMVGPPFAAHTILQRSPETVSLSSPRSDSGLFQLRLDDPMLLPFEGSGVETTWTIELAKGANRFNFDTLVDVLMTMRYTAKDDYGYRQRIVADLETQFTALANFSARQSFADAWFHLHNPIFRQNPVDYGFGPGQVPPPYTLRFQLGRHHFPANELDVTIRRLQVISAQEASGRIPVRVEFTPAGGGVALVANNQEIVDGQLSLGVFSGRPPFGTWTLTLRTDAAVIAYPEFFAGSSAVFGQVRLNLSGLREILFVLEYSSHVRYPRP